MPQMSSPSARPVWRDTDPAMDPAIKELRSKTKEWASLPAAKRAELLDECFANFRHCSEAFVDAACQKRRVDAHHMAERTYCFLASSFTLSSWMCGIRRCLEHAAEKGALPAGGSRVHRSDASPDRQLVSDVTSNMAFIEKLAMGFAKMELFCKDNQSDSKTPNIAQDPVASSSQTVVGAREVDGAASRYTQGVAVVLGAGNYDAPLDILTALFVDNNAVIYKESPLFEEVSEIVRIVFKPLVDAGYVLFVKGDIEFTSRLLHHEGVDCWYMTGSKDTAMAVMWGKVHDVDPDVDRVKLAKPTKLGLGNCSPVFIVPGNWMSKFVDLYAQHIALSMVANGGHLCAHTQVIYTCKNWKQRDAFLAALRKAIAEAKTCGSFYPGAKSKYRQLKKLADASSAGEASVVETRIECYPAEDAEAHKTNEYLFPTDVPNSSGLLKTEAFALATVEVCLDTEPNAAAFLKEAVKCANRDVEGSLCATIIVKESSKEDSKAVDEAVGRLKFGVVGVNVWAVAGMMCPYMVWGGHPQASRSTDLQSGQGWLGNITKCHGVEKAVIRSHFVRNMFLLVGMI
eukprot:Selendium_serpulae@DN6082_c1_g1_i5.p1